MCIGTPMQARQCRPGRALATGRGRSEVVDTRLVGAVEPGDWLLVFQGAAREKLDPVRAAEIDATLDLLLAGLGGDAAGGAASFVLPSAMSAEAVAALAGAARVQGDSR